MTNTIETTILRNLIHNEDYLRKVIPFLKEDYFYDQSQKIVFNLINDFVKKYNKTPSIESLLITLQDSNTSESYFESSNTLLNSLNNENIDDKWLYDASEKFCKDKAVYNAILKSIAVIDGKDKQLSKEGIPDILTEALGVSFDRSVGHDYIDDAESRYDFYNRKEDRIPFDLEYMNKITQGGLPNKTLNIVMAGTGVGKSLFMCHIASSILSQGKNVLYITLEMAEERIAERLDANLLNIELDQIKDLPKQMYNSRISKYSEKTNGKLIVKEYPTATAHTGHFKSLLNELSLKRDFVPDIIFIDYLNICASSRFKQNANINSYTYIKAIAEELRGLAVEYNLPVVSATQVNRSAYGSSDVELTDTSESFGLPATADFMFALVSTEEFEDMNQLMVKQLKNRYNDPTINKRFMIGVDRAKMRLYDVDQSAQSNILDNKDGIDDNIDYSLDKVFNKDFTGIKV